MTEEISKAPVAVVTGGSRGIGAAVVEHLAQTGATVYFSYLSHPENARALEERLCEEGHNAIGKKADASSVTECEDFIKSVIDEHGHLDMLVNNAGVTADCLLAMMKQEDWSRVIDVSLNGMFGASRRATLQMMRQRSGRIVNITSISGLIGVSGQSNYCAAKAGIIGFTRALAKETARSGVRVNAVAPGYIETDMTSRFGKKQREAALLSIPMQRFGKPDEVAQMVVYLLLEAPDYFTGQVLTLDGGLT